MSSRSDVTDRNRRTNGWHGHALGAAQNHHDDEVTQGAGATKEGAENTEMEGSIHDRNT